MDKKDNFGNYIFSFTKFKEQTIKVVHTEQIQNKTTNETKKSDTKNHTKY